MDNPLFWLLVFPVMLVIALYYLGVLTVGLGFIGAAFKTRRPALKVTAAALGIVFISSPFIYPKVQRAIAENKADQRQVQLAQMERVNLANRLPKKFVIIGRYKETDIALIENRYGLSQFPVIEDIRLTKAYIKYRSAADCKRHTGRKRTRKTIIPACSQSADTLQSILKMQEPALFFIEGLNTSYRPTGTLIGKIYEARLITSTENLLVDYFEQKTVESPPSFINPFKSDRDLDLQHKPPAAADFIEAVLEDASHSNQDPKLRH